MGIPDVLNSPGGLRWLRDALLFAPPGHPADEDTETHVIFDRADYAARFHPVECAFLIFVDDLIRRA
jgi:hypothetical protein